MKRRSSSSNFISFFNHGSNVNNLGSIQQYVDSMNASGQGDHSSSIGWIGQSSSIGSSHNQVTPEELMAEHGWLPSPVANIGIHRLEERHSEPNSDKNLGAGVVTLGPSTSQSGTSDAVPQKLDLNVAYEDSSGTIRQDIGADYVNQISSLEGNTEIFERNTRRRINPANEQYFPSSSMSSSVHAGGTSQTLHPSYRNWITSPSSSSISSVSPIILASGSDALWQEENSRYIPRSTSVQSILVPGTGMGNPGQNIITSRAVLRNYTSQNGGTSVQLGASPGFHQHNVTRGFQNGFTGGVRLSSTLPRFSPRNMAEEYAERLSNVVNNSTRRLAGFGSGGQIGYLRPPSSASVTMRGMVEPRPGIVRALQALPRPRILMMRAEGRNAVVPPILPPLQPLVAAQWRARLLDSMIIHGPVFYEEPEGHDVHEDMRLDVDNMSYEELLALEEQIGNVSTGLSEEAILGGMSRHRYQSMKLGPPVEEPCCICQDDYVDGEELAKLDCGHDFHFNCIKKWLVQKNTCPICKANALAI